MTSTTNKSLPATLIGGSFAAGIAGAFVYNQYLSRITQEERRHNTTSRRRSSTTTPPLHSLFNANDISLRVLNHLTRVYTTLGATTLAAVVGVLVQQQTHVSSRLSSLISLGFALVLATTQPMLWKLLGLGFFNGMGLGELITLAMRISPQVVPLALASTSAVFLSFAAAATLSTRRSLLYLYGTLGSALSILAVSGVANLFVQSERVFTAQLYGGLAVFIGYVCADSQLIVERADAGDSDYVSHAWMLFTDLSGLFSRLLIILIRMQETEEKKKRERKRRRDEED